MTPSIKLAFTLTLAAGALALISGAAVLAQNATKPEPKATVNDPPGALPDPTHIPIVLPKDIKWRGTPGRSENSVLYGDPTKPGSPYGVLTKWYPGAFSHPHFHRNPRWIYVVSGTWWVSSSNVYDERLTYPVPAGSYVQDLTNTVHWDGNRTGSKEPTVILITGIGSSQSTRVDEQGNPVAPEAGRAGGD